ncbi:unnamed protein product [Closterium sp. Naga37s-1]|nr:unnamed protein product [Closterium sp. Naga37s-1]
MVVTAHRVTSDFKLQQMVIDFRPLEGRHTGDKIATELEQVIGEGALGGGEFFGVTSDNAENNNRAVRLLADVSDHTPGCVAHVLNLAVQYALEVEPVAEALRRLRAVASHIGWSVQRSERFFDIQRQYVATRAATQAEGDTEEGGERHAEGGTVEGGATQGEGGSSARKVPADLRLIVDSDTRWGSTLEMVVRGCDLHIPLTMHFDESTVRHTLGMGRDQAVQCSLVIPNELRAFLEPFDRISLEEVAIATFLDLRLKTATFRLRARGARTSAPIVVEAGGHARGARALDLSKERVKALVRERLPPYQTAARAAAEARVGGEVTSASVVTGAGAGVGGSAGRRGGRSRGVLDFQARLFAGVAEMEAEEGVGAQDEVDQYLTEARQQLPGLRAMARDYVGIPATSAANERAFSQSRNIIWWQRHRLSPQ